jgi:uncharacterized protein YndB with AHSA1/START domain
MSVKIDQSGRRYVQVEAEIPGTPEDVWQAIATGPGISSWFVPTDLEERVGGRIVSHFGPGMDSTATVTAWEPPHRFTAEGEEFLPGAPPLATEWTVEARGSGICVVRVVHSLFASTDEWDNQLESTETGWPTFFHILRLYLDNFRGEPCATMSAMGMTSADVAQAWDTLTGGLGLSGSEPGERCAATSAGAPPLAGTVEPIEGSGSAAAPQGRTLLLRLQEPAQGFGLLGAYNCHGPVMANIAFYLYGDRAAEVAARDQPLWHAWMSERFPAAGAATQGGQ